MIIAFLGGIILGFIFFGGLYWSVRNLSTVKYPAFFMIASIILRMAILLIGFFFLINGDYKNLLAALIGVLFVRFVMVFNLQERKQPPNFEKQKE